jgi:hypothetical protein
MADPSANRETGAEPTTGPPRWVKVFGVIALVVIVLVLILLLTGGPGRHGPGRHAGGLGDDTPPAGVNAHNALLR